MSATVTGIHLGPDTHANRPAANAAGQPIGALYSCTTHGLIYKTDGSTWSTYATLGAAASGSITASGYTQNTARLLGRTTASSGAIEEITVGSGLSLSGGSLSATGGGGTAAHQQYDYPTSFGADDLDGSSVASLADVGANAFGTRASTSGVIRLAATGASQACVGRVTLGTTKSGDFDFRTYVIPEWTFWSSNDDTFFEWVLATSGGTVVASMRLNPREAVTSTIQGYRIGVGAVGSYSSFRGEWIPRGQGAVLRMVRSSGTINFYYGLGAFPLALTPVIDTGANTPAARSDSGTVARVEYRITTPAGPGSSAYQEMVLGWMQVAA